jgi:hypothetical protein
MSNKARGVSECWKMKERQNVARRSERADRAQVQVQESDWRGLHLHALEAPKAWRSRDQARLKMAARVQIGMALSP